jgi:multisubunit Na+/H+ antiporter MnhB subunit
VVSIMRIAPGVGWGALAVVAIIVVMIAVMRHRKGGASMWPQRWTPRLTLILVGLTVVAFLLILGAMWVFYPGAFGS